MRSGGSCPRRWLRLAASLLLLLGTNGSAASKPDIRRNSQPRALYDVTVTVRGAPGPFDRTEGWTDYRVTNEPCAPLTPITGATSAPEWREPIALEAVGDNIYKGQVVTDLLADENYYGLGVCHWDVVAATVIFAARRQIYDAVVQGKTEARASFHPIILKYILRHNRPRPSRAWQNRPCTVSRRSQQDIFHHHSGKGGQTMILSMGG